MQHLTVNPNYVFIEGEQDHLIDGGLKAEVVSGSLGASLVPRMMEHFAEGRSLDTLSDSFKGVPRNELSATLTSLLDWGLLIPTSERRPIASVGYLSRAAGPLRAKEVISSLRGSFISLFGSTGQHELVRTIETQLKSNGLSVSAQTVGASIDGGSTSDGTLVLCVTDTSDPDRQELYAKLLASKQRFLRVDIDTDANSIAIGPVFGIEPLLCVECLRVAQFAAARDEAPGGILNLQLCGGIIATSVVELLIGSRAISRSYTCYDLRNLNATVETWPAAGKCLHHDLSQRVDPKSRYLRVHAYEEIVARRTSISSDASSLERRSPKNDLRPMLNCAQIKLRSDEGALAVTLSHLLLRGIPQSRTRPSLAQIGAFMALVFGERRRDHSTVKRWCASAGNRGSFDGILVITAHPEIASGVYYYRPEVHQLARFPFLDPDAIASFSGGTVHRGAWGILITIGTLRRLELKYREFAFKLLHLDAGVLASHLGMVSTALDIAVNAHPPVNSANLAWLLNLEARECVTNVFLLGGSKHPRPVSGLERAGEMSSISEDVTEVDVTLDSIVDLLLKDGRMVGSSIVKHRKISFAARIQTAWRLRSLPTDVTLGRALNIRASVRKFSDEVPDRSTLVNLLSLACAEIPDEAEYLSIYVLVQNTHTANIEVFEYDLIGRKLNALASLTDVSSLSGYIVSDGVGAFPALFWLSVDLKRCEDAKVQYEDVLMGAGMLSHRLNMCLPVVGLGGAIIAGISSEASAFQRRGETALIAVSCGHPDKREALVNQVGE